MSWRVQSADVDALEDAFGQHDDGEIDGGGGDVGDDRGVDDPQSAYAVDGADGVGDGPRVAGSAHRRGRGGVAVDGQVAGDYLGQSVVGDRVSGDQLPRRERREDRVAGDRAPEPDGLQHAPGVAAGGQEAVVDQRGVAGVPAGQPQRPSGLGLDDGGGQHDRPAGGAEGPVEQVGCGDVQV